MFDELVEIDAEQFERKAQMLTVNEGVLQAKQMVVVVLVIFAIELWDISKRAIDTDWEIDAPNLTQKPPSYSG